MAIPVSKVAKHTYRLLAPVMLCGFMRGQIAAPTPVVSAAPAASA